MNFIAKKPNPHRMMITNQHPNSQNPQNSHKSKLPPRWREPPSAPRRGGEGQPGGRGVAANTQGGKQPPATTPGRGSSSHRITVRGAAALEFAAGGAAATRSTLSRRRCRQIHRRLPSPSSDPPWEGGERGQREPPPDPSSSAATAAGSTRGRRRRRHRCRIYRGREARWRGGDGERRESIRGSLGLPVSDHSLRLKLLASEYHRRLHVFALQEDLHGDGIVDLAGNSREKEGRRRCCG